MSKITEKLIKDCKKEGGKSQKKLFEIMYSDLYKICYRYSNRKDQAEEYLQIGFIKIFEKLKTYKFKGSFEGWCKRIVVNSCIDEMRKNKIIFLGGLEDVADEFVEPIVPYETIEEDKFTAEKILKAIQELTPAYKTCFNLYVLDGYTHREISEKIKISIGASKSNVHKAKQKIIKKLKIC